MEMSLDHLKVYLANLKAELAIATKNEDVTELEDLIKVTELNILKNAELMATRLKQFSQK